MKHLQHIPNKILKEDNGDNATIYLYGRIGQQPSLWDDSRKDEDITDVTFLNAMKAFEADGKKRVDVRLNSPGGSMLHMDGIMAIMQSSKMEVHVWVDGLAASAAADIFLSVPKERRHMAKNAKLMIHEPQGVCVGSARMMRQNADMLDVFAEGSIAQMSADTGMTEDEVRSKYYDGADHWMTARQCVELGFLMGEDDYLAEKVPATPEKMTAIELEKFYEPTKEADEPTWLGKLIAAVSPIKAAAQTVSPVKIDEEMNIENFKASFGKDISEDEITKCLNELGFDVTKKAAPAETPTVDVAKAAADAVAAAIKPLQDEITAMKAVMDKTPGSVGPTPGKAAGDPPSEDGDGNTDLEVLKKMADSDVAALKNGMNPFSRV